VNVVICVVQYCRKEEKEEERKFGLANLWCLRSPATPSRIHPRWLLGGGSGWGQSHMLGFGPPDLTVSKVKKVSWPAPLTPTRPNNGNSGLIFFSAIQSYRRSEERRIPNAMNPTQTLPRFLLPRLSWGGASSIASRSRASTAILQQQPRTGQQNGGLRQASGRSFHTGRANGALCFQRPTVVTSSGMAGGLGKPSNAPLLRRSFQTSQARRRDHHFDTLKFVQRLEEEGFTEEQSVAMMKVLNDVIEER